jgi:hypothetical protein
MSKQTSVVLFLLACCACLHAQSGVDSGEPLHIGSVKVSGSILERMESWDWFGGVGQNNYTFSGSLVQIAFSQSTPSFDWKIDLAAPILLGLPHSAAVAAPQGQLGLGGSYYAANDSNRFAAMIFPKEAYIRFKNDNSSLQLGRFEFADGSEATPSDQTLASVKKDRIGQRLIGTFGFTDVRRSFDGVHGSYNSGPWNVTAVAATPTRGVFQVDGWGWVTTPFAYVSATRQVHHSKTNSAEWRVFGIFYDDPRGNILKTDNRPTAARALDQGSIRIGTYGGHYIQAIHMNSATVDLVAWGALQSGNWGSLTQRAAAGAAEAGIQPNILKAVKPWIRGGYYYGSGDGNSQDGTHGTFFALLPTPRVYARFPFFNEMNNRDAFGEVILRPAKTVTVRVDGHHLSLASAKDLWYTGGGAFQPWTFGFQGRPSNGKSDFANLYDASLDYAFNKAASIGFYYGYAQGGDVIKAIYKNPNGNLGFIELNYRF